MAASVPKKLQFRAANFMSYNAVHVGRLDSKEVRTEDGLKLTLPENSKGLGIELDPQKLGEPILVFE